MKMNPELVWGRAPSPVQAHVGAGALTCPAERSSAAVGSHNRSAFIRALLVLALLAFVSTARAQGQSAPQSSAPASAESTKDANQPAPAQKTIGGELAQETREATGADEEEENAKLKHAAPVQWLARKTGLSVHQAHLLALSLNFAIIAGIVFWAARKFVPGMLRDRSTAIQRALEEARAASQDANRRLAEIENRLRQLDVEIGRMQATAEKEGDAEEVRVQQAAEEDVRKVVLAAEQEIAAAAKQARRELTSHTAGLAIALARQQINVDAKTDQVLVRDFAANLAPKDGGKDDR